MLFFSYSVFLSVLNLPSVCGTVVQYAAVPVTDVFVPGKTSFSASAAEKMGYSAPFSKIIIREKSSDCKAKQQLFCTQEAYCYIVDIGAG